ncbi:MAG: DUF655 domain-containing protein [Candidatus Methanomethylophilaceae archaeon]|nr:DUF655 domain-containing protein [Candidatus Methanomethylophilaceae archaeon]
MEEYAVILDFLAQGTAGGPKYGKREPLAYAVGEKEFRLFELVPKATANILVGDRVFIGRDEGKREVIDHVKRRIGFNDLTSNAASELEYAVVQIVLDDEAKYIQFYNNAEAINLKKHLLEELPGLGKKSVGAILESRKQGPFQSFDDLSARAGIKNPEKYIAARICLEIQDPDRKRYLFVSR